MLGLFDSQSHQIYADMCIELMRLMLAQELFVFVYRDGVDGNNNASERELRDDALARRTGRTSQTPSGAKRRSIISSVLRSIEKQVQEFTLPQVIAEVKQWMIRSNAANRAWSPQPTHSSSGRTRAVDDIARLNSKAARAPSFMLRAQNRQLPKKCFKSVYVLAKNVSNSAATPVYFEKVVALHAPAHAIQLE